MSAKKAAKRVAVKTPSKNQTTEFKKAVKEIVKEKAAKPATKTQLTEFKKAVKAVKTAKKK